MRNRDKVLKLPFICFLIVGIGACSIQKTPATSRFQNPPSPEYAQLMETGRMLVNERSHQKAGQIFDQAGILEPQRPEWLYEKSRALFYMNRIPESIVACDQAIKLDPSLYDARSFDWAIRLVAEKSSDEIKETVRREIEDLLNRTSGETRALLAAYEGYQWLNDRVQERNLILKLANFAAAENQEFRELIAARLFEEIVQEKNDEIARIALLEAYVYNFPQERHASHAVFQLMKTTCAQNTDAFDDEAFAERILNNPPRSWQKNMGVALWLIENNRRPAQAVALINERLELAQKHPAAKPHFFKAGLWRKEQEKQTDKAHLLLGRAWFNAGNYDEAKKAFHRVVEKNRPLGDAYYYLGKIALAEGQASDAVDYFHHSLTIGERSDDAEDILARLLAREIGYEGTPQTYFSTTGNIHGIIFTDVTEAAGLENLSAGRAAWGDFDQDGLDDVLLDGNRLFRNAGNGLFIDRTNASGLDSLRNTNGGIWGDYNNDGRPDVFVTGRARNYLFENTGNGVFEDRSTVLPGAASRLETEAAAWGDLDNDGFIDLYVANFETWGVMRAIGNHDRLYRNVDGDRFEDISDRAGIQPDEAMCGRGVTWTDINSDGFQDIVVANYRLDPNFLWLNHLSGLTENADGFGVRGTMVDGAFGHSIGPVSGDLNNDGDLDLFITNLAHPRYIEFSDVNMMLINQGFPEYRFSDHFADSGIVFEETNADPVLADIDNDGDLDLYMTSIYPGRYAHLYVNDGNGFFTDISWSSGTRAEDSWGAAFADYNNDGFPDLIVASARGIRLFENNGNANHWVKVKIFDARCNRFGIGSRVTVTYDDNQQVREVTAGRGTGNQDSMELIFGLGEYAGPVEIEAKTLCGNILRTEIMHPDQRVVLTQ